MDTRKKEEFIAQNLDRIVEQCTYGDESMSFLAVYSFIEGYLRERCGISFRSQNGNNNREPNFSIIVKDRFDELLRLRHDVTTGDIGGERQNRNDIIKYHGTNDIASLNTGTDTNRVRHCFAKIADGSLSISVKQLYDFIKYREFDDNETYLQKLQAVLDSGKVRDSRNALRNTPPDGSILYNQKNDLLDKYRSVRYQVAELPQEYCDFIFALSQFLIEARTKRDYENRIVKTSNDQEKIINERIPKLSDRNDSQETSDDAPFQSLLIKGGPGTGKTLVLIAALFKLTHQPRPKSPVLLTYHPCLNKYIEYLFELYNRKDLLEAFNIRPLTISQLETFRSTGIKPFGEYMCERLSGCFTKRVYSLASKENQLRLKQLFAEVSDSEKETERLYDFAVKQVWANTDATETLLPSAETERRKKAYELILQVERKIDNGTDLPDAYAYHKFCVENTSTFGIINSLADYILIDEVQDLTNAQIAVAGRMAKIACVFAGDITQSIRNSKISWKALGIDITHGFSTSLKQNFRSSELIQKLGEKYKEYCTVKDNADFEAMLPGPPPQLFITNDTDDSAYYNTYAQVIASVNMCIKDLAIMPENICIVAFTENELRDIQRRLKNEINIESCFISDSSFSFHQGNTSETVKLSTVSDIKGIDCPVVLFMISDQSKKENQGGISNRNRANAIYTVITRTMYLLQIFVPEYCKTSDIAVAALVHTMKNGSDEVCKQFIEEYKRQQRETAQNVSLRRSGTQHESVNISNFVQNTPSLVENSVHHEESILILQNQEQPVQTDVDEERVYQSRVVEKEEGRWMNIETPLELHSKYRFRTIAAYFYDNRSLFNNYREGDKVSFRIVAAPTERYPNRKKAFLLPLNSKFKVTSIGQDELLGTLMPPVCKIKKASISKENLDVKEIVLETSLINRLFTVKITGLNTQRNSWICDII